MLNGRHGNGRITDTDKGQFDGDQTWDRAVGPMQIIPQVWDEFGADGNGDGFRNPNNVYDAVTTVAVVLCSEGDDLKAPRDLVAALLRYQHSKDFVATVLRWMRVYSKNAVLVPNAEGRPDGRRRPPATPSARSTRARCRTSRTTPRRRPRRVADTRPDDASRRRRRDG